LNALVTSSGLDLQLRTTETPEEREVRLRQLEKDAAFRRWRDGSLFAVCLAATTVLGYVCVGIVLSVTASPDDKKWATSLITLIVGGIIGFLTGKSRS
jgi:hypothetical protein